MDRTDLKIDTPVARGCSGPVPAEIAAELGLSVLPSMPRGPLVYFLREARLVKIGFTHRLSQRFAQLDGTKRLTLLGTVPGTMTTERMYHDRFAHLRSHGEWFWAAQDLLEVIEKEATAPTFAPTYKDVAAAYMKKNKGPHQRISAAASHAKTQIGLWLNMLAEGETPERLANLDAAMRLKSLI